MQHRLDLVGSESLARFTWQAGHWSHLVGRLRNDAETAFAEFARKVARQIRTGKIKQRAGLFQQRALIRTEGDELQGNRQAAFKGVLRAEQALDDIIEVDTAGLQFGADGIIDAICRAMLDLVS